MCMAVWSQVKVCGWSLSLQPVCCMPALPVTQKCCCSCGMRLVAVYKCYMPMPLPQIGNIVCCVCIVSVTWRTRWHTCWACWSLARNLQSVPHSLRSVLLLRRSVQTSGDICRRFLKPFACRCPSRTPLQSLCALNFRPLVCTALVIAPQIIRHHYMAGVTKCWTTVVEQPFVQPTIVWPYPSAVTPGVKDIFVWLTETPAPSDFLFVVCYTNALTYLLSWVHNNIQTCCCRRCWLSLNYWNSGTGAWSWGGFAM